MSVSILETQVSWHRIVQSHQSASIVASQVIVQVTAGRSSLTRSPSPKIQPMTFQRSPKAKVAARAAHSLTAQSAGNVLRIINYAKQALLTLCESQNTIETGEMSFSSTKLFRKNEYTRGEPAKCLSMRSSPRSKKMRF